MNTRRTKPDRRALAQRGVSLIFALLTLAVMSLAAVVLVRSVDTGTQVLGNLGFKQDATAASDRATEAAIAWLQTNGGATLDADATSAGYYASSLDKLDPTGRATSAANKLAVINWGDSDSCACVSAGTCASCTLLPSAEVTYGGNRSRYLISRICQSAGPVSATNVCAKPASAATSEAASREEIHAGKPFRPTKLVSNPYYRIIVRTVGGRNAVSFTETIVHF